MRMSKFSIFAQVLFALTVFIPSQTSAGQSDQFPRNEIIDKVACRADAKQSYSLYLPAQYTPEKKWPILYAFDPAARGKLPVSLFKEAAEKYGFIVVGSNNSRNGIAVSDIVKALWDDTHARLSIDERRVYAAGFSGGARVATAVGNVYPVAGVIASSGGFTQGAPPTLSTPFVLFGTAGTEDFNFPEMQQLRRKLDSVGITNRLAIFEGEHDWPPASLCAEAIAWMEAQAMKAGTRSKDEALVNEIYSRKMAEARKLEAANELYSAYDEYDALVSELKGLRDVSEPEAFAGRLRNSKEVKAAQKVVRAEEEKQASLMARFQTLLGQLKDVSSFPLAGSELRLFVTELTEQSDAKKDPSRRRVARRVLQSLLVQMYEEANLNFQRKNLALIPPALEIASEIRPRDPRVFYDLAVAYSRVGSKTKAISALNRAIENGFTDLAQIEQNQDFASLQNEAGYQKLVIGLKKRL